MMKAIATVEEETTGISQVNKDKEIRRRGKYQLTLGIHRLIIITIISIITRHIEVRCQLVAPAVRVTDKSGTLKETRRNSVLVSVLISTME
jgi:hypothetical protein